MTIHARLVGQISGILKDANISFESNPVLGGIRPDFLVQIPNGPSIVIEAKAWEPPFNMKRAIKQANFYKTVTEADHALVVTEKLKHSTTSKNLIPVKDLPDVISQLLEHTKKAKKRALSPSKTKRTVFGSMPFSSAYDDVYFVAMTHAAKSVDATCIRIDKEEFTGDITDKIKKSITESIAVIADISESKPNVLYEVGFAHAIDKPTAHICSTSLEELPFIVQSWNTIQYSKGQTHILGDKLARRLQAVLKGS